MSGTGEVSADFAGEERAFRLRLGEIRRIEAKCETGVGEILRRLARSTLILAQSPGLQGAVTGLDFRADDVREVIYQGLKGGGMSDAEATKLIRQEVDDRGLQGLMDGLSTALKVLWGSQEAPKDDALGELRAGESPATPPNPSTSPSSTASELQSA